MADNDYGKCSKSASPGERQTIAGRDRVLVPRPRDLTGAQCRPDLALVYFNDPDLLTVRGDARPP
jgi:hypothetical protein